MARREGVVMDRRRVAKEWVGEYCIQGWGQDAALADSLGILDGLGFCVVPLSCGSGPCVPGCDESFEENSMYVDPARIYIPLEFI